jgi:hypothetical protein
MNASTKAPPRRVSPVASALLLCAVTAIVPLGSAHGRGFLGGAIGGAIIGGVLGGDDGAAAGAIIGGMSGAAQASAQREEQRRRESYIRAEQERRRQQQEERLRIERERNELLRQQQASARPSGAGADVTLVRQTQSALTLLGFDIGVADGRMNEATVTAIRAYQQSSGLLATGSPSPELLDHMKRQF